MEKWIKSNAILMEKCSHFRPSIQFSILTFHRLEPYQYWKFENRLNNTDSICTCSWLNEKNWQVPMTFHPNDTHARLTIFNIFINISQLFMKSIDAKLKLMAHALFYTNDNIDHHHWEGNEIHRGAKNENYPIKIIFANFIYRKTHTGKNDGKIYGCNSISEILFLFVHFFTFWTPTFNHR